MEAAGISLAFKSLDAKDATGAGSSVNYGRARSKFALQVKTTGAPTSATVVLEITLNGSDWVTAATWTQADANGDIKFGVDKPAVAARANLTVLSGGTSPTVSAWIAAAE